MQKLDDKYHIENEQIIKTGNGIPIDLENEPVILFRARDVLALPMLQFYRELCVKAGATQYQMESIDNRIRLFEDFARTSPTIKMPGSTMGR